MLSLRPKRLDVKQLSSMATHTVALVRDSPLRRVSALLYSTQRKLLRIRAECLRVLGWGRPQYFKILTYRGSTRQTGVAFAPCGLVLKVMKALVTATYDNGCPFESQ